MLINQSYREIIWGYVTKIRAALDFLVGGEDIQYFLGLQNKK